MAYFANGGHNYHKRTVIIPPITDQALVFPLDQDTKKFDKGFYSAALTDGRASCDQIEGFLRDVEETFKDKLRWLRIFKAYLLFSFITGLFLMVAYTFVVISDIGDDFDNYEEYGHHHKGNFRHQAKHSAYDPEQEVENMFFMWMISFFSATFWSVVYTVAKGYAIKRARKGVQNTLDKYQSTFASAGLRWNLPLAFPHYIELWKDYRGLNYVSVNNNNQAILQNNNGLNYTPLYKQVQPLPHQVQPHNFEQRYPNLVQDACLDFQKQGFALNQQLLQAQRVADNNNNNYVPPNSIHLL